MDSNPDLKAALKAELDAERAALRAWAVGVSRHVQGLPMPDNPLDGYRILRMGEMADKLLVRAFTPAEELRPVRRAVADKPPQNDEEDLDDEEDLAIEEWRALLREKVEYYRTGRHFVLGDHIDAIRAARATAPAMPEVATTHNQATDDATDADDAAPHSPARTDARPGHAPSPHPDVPPQPAGLRETDSGPRIRSLAPEWPPP